jgi:hypothetical protein
MTISERRWIPRGNQKPLGAGAVKSIPDPFSKVSTSTVFEHFMSADEVPHCAW